MSYSYEAEKKIVFTDEGQRQFLRIRDFCQRQLKEAGAVQAGKAMSAWDGGGDSWEMMACVDRLVELGELREVTDPTKCVWQHRVFVDGRRQT